jgi:hypothetical protein
MPNPSIATDWHDKAAPAGYVKRYAASRGERKESCFSRSTCLFDSHSCYFLRCLISRRLDYGLGSWC